MLYTAKVEVASTQPRKLQDGTVVASKFKTDTNGIAPFLLVDPSSGKIHPYGGIINGTVGQRLGLKAGMICTFSVTAKKVMTSVGERINYSHSIFSDLTQEISKAAAAAVIGNLFASDVQSQQPITLGAAPNVVPSDLDNLIESSEEELIDEFANSTEGADTFGG